MNYYTVLSNALVLLPHQAGRVVFIVSIVRYIVISRCVTALLEVSPAGCPSLSVCPGCRESSPAL